MFYAEKLGSYVGIKTIGSNLALSGSKFKIKDNYSKEILLGAKFNEKIDDKYKEEIEDAYAEQVSNDFCKNCNLCIEACPTKAIYPEGYRINPLKCISFITRHIDEPDKILPDDISKLNNWLHGCEICQSVCPVNRSVDHKNNVLREAEIDLYGMKVNNQGIIDKKMLQEKTDLIEENNYLNYIERILNKDK